MAASHRAVDEENPDIHIQIDEDEQKELEERAEAAYTAAKAAQDVALQAEKNFKIAKNTASRKKSKAKRLGYELKAQTHENPELKTRHLTAVAAAKQAQRNLELAQKEFEKASAKAKAANTEFNAQLPKIYWRSFAEKLAALAVTTLVFSFYQFKTSIKSINEVADVWGYEQPPAHITTPIGIIVTSVDTIFNALLVNLTLEVLKDVMRHYEKYQLKPASWLQEFSELLAEAKNHPGQVPINLFHFAVKKIHNYASGASYILGVDEWIDPLIGVAKWPFYIGILHLSDIFFRNSQDEKYDKGAKIFWKQINTLTKKVMFEGEIIRALDIVIRGVLAGGVLRGLNFYSIWENFSKLSAVPRLISPKIVGVLTLCHALSVRCTKSYLESGFAHQEKLRDLFAQQLIDASLQELAAENNPQLDARQLQLLALTRAAGTEIFFQHPEDARLPDEVIEKISRVLLLEKADKLSRKYSVAQKKTLEASLNRRESLANFMGHLPIGAARAGLVYLVNDYFLSAYWQNLLVTLGLSAEDAENTTKYFVSPMTGFLAGMIYHLASTRNKMDRRILDTFDTPKPAAAIDGENIVEEDASDLKISYFQRFKNWFNIENTSKWSGYGISLTAGVSRIGGQVYASAQPMINAGLNKKIASMSALELALEQVINSMDVFTVDVQKTLKGYFEYLLKKEIPVTPQPSTVVSPATSPHSLFNRKTEEMKKPLLEQKESAETTSGYTSPRQALSKN